MFYLTHRDYATLILDSGTLLIDFSIIYLILQHRKKERADEGSFLVLLIMNIAMAAGDTLGYLFENKAFPGSRELSIIGMTVFYIAFVFLSMTWLHYCRIRFRDGDIPKLLRLTPAYLPGTVMLFLIVINIFTGWVFFYDANWLYHRGGLFIPMYLMVTGYIIAGILCVSKYRNHSAGRTPVPAWVFLLPIAAGVVFTFFVPNSASFAPFSTAVFIAFSHMGTISEETLTKNRNPRN